ncbi:MAG: phage terminase large subunit [Bdellovibrionales bacterium]|nr:phage terminase large subunit [Bdellovibrionales bacterium]
MLEQGGWDHLCLPAEYERIERRTSLGWMDPRRQQGELLWPERFGRTEIDTLKRSLGSYAAAAQLQQRPSPAEGGLLKRHWWRFWKPRDVSVPSMTIRSSDGSLQTAMTVDIPEYCDEQLQSWDCAFKDLDTSDYVVGQVWCRAGGDYFLLDQRRDKMDCPATVRAVRELTRDWPRAMAKLIEDKANGSAVIQMLQHELPGLIPVNPEGGKAARASAVSPIVESGNVYLPHPSIAPWVDDFIEECASFPNGRHDDQVDAATQALLRLAVGREEETVIVYDDFVEISPY